MIFESSGGPRIRYSGDAARGVVVMHVCRVLAWIGAALMASGCVHNGDGATTMWIDSYAVPNPTPAAFHECHGFRCAVISSVSLNKQQWGQVVATFQPRAKDAASERRQISKALSTVRLMVGAQTGTAVHQWARQGVVMTPNGTDMTQLDCIDETVNTHTYLTMMQSAGLLRLHRVATPVNAGTAIDIRN